MGLVAVAAASPVPAFELNAVLSAPRASSLVRSEAGSTLAWVENRAGHRSVQVAAAPDYAVRELYAVEGDAGEPLGKLLLSPDGDLLALVRGGGPNTFGDLANPASRPRGADVALS